MYLQKSQMQTRSRDLIFLLDDWAKIRPEICAFRFLSSGESDKILTYRDLRSSAVRLSRQLLGEVDRGGRVVLALPAGLEFVTAFVACLYAGVVAVPAYPANGRSRSVLSKIIEDCGAELVLCATSGLDESSHCVVGDAGGRARCLTFEGLQGLAINPTGPLERSERESNDLAYLQYTSGSTSDPKGVMISNSNIVENCFQISEAAGLDAASIFVSWLPHYHDMGLIGGIIQPIFLGAQAILLSASAVAQKPIRWLEAIDRFRASASGGPNFIYEHCADYMAKHQHVPLDLSCWEIACVGAEPVRAATLTRFSEVCRPFGFRSEAFFPAYGLAEATVMATGRRLNTKSGQPSFGSEAVFDRGGTAPNEASRGFVSCGPGLIGETVIIVDPVSRMVCSDEVEGEIWISGPNVAKGYWGEPVGGQERFGAHCVEFPHLKFLRTGDLGFLIQGELYVSGRVKDLVIIRGQNFHPEDIELATDESHAALIRGRSAAFDMSDYGDEGLVIVVELRRNSREKPAAIAEAIRRNVAGTVGVVPENVVFLRYGTIPRGTSGKVQRHRCRVAYAESTLNILYDSKAAAVLGANGGISRSTSILGDIKDRGKILIFFMEILENVLGFSKDHLTKDVALRDLGLDSIKIFRIRNMIYEHFEVEMEFEDFFRDFTVFDLAQHIRDRVLIESALDLDLDENEMALALSEVSDLAIEKYLKS